MTKIGRASPASGTGPTLIMASDTSIRRHIKIISQAHPFDPEWTPTFEERKRKPTFREAVKKKIQAVKAFLGFPDTPGK